MTEPLVPAAALPRRPRLLLALIAAFTTLPLLGLRDLWHTDEPRYAQVAREILTSGDAVVMHLNQEVYREKPPLLFWMEAAIGRVAGDVGPWSARLPSALFGIAGVVLLFELGRRLLGRDRERTAFLGALFLATTFHWWWISQRAAFDVVMGTWVLAAVLCEEIAREREKSTDGRAADPRGALRWRLGFFAATGFAFLTKGPPALLFAFVALVARAFAARDLGSLKRVPWLRGLLVLAAVLALWIGPQWARLGLHDLLANFKKQTAGRMGDDAPHSQPPWYFLKTLPLDSLPWSIVAIGGGIVAWRRERRASVAWRFALAWIGAALILFSCFRGKRNLYLIPLAPPIALFAATVAEQLGGRWISCLTRAATIVALLFGAGGLALMPALDATRTPRPLGERVRREVEAGRHVALVGLRHPDSVLYFSGLPRLDIVDAARLAVLADLHRSDQAGPDAGRLVFVTEAEEGAAIVGELPRGADPLDSLVVDDTEYRLWRAR